MEIEAKITVPKLIYDIYSEAAKELGESSVERVMSCALHAYAQHLFEEMMSNGELSEE